MPANALTLQDKKKIFFLYIEGKTKKEICETYNISLSALNNIIANKDKVSFSTDPLHKQYEIFQARENQIIMNLKEKTYELTAEAIEEGHSQKNKLYYLTKIKDILAELDKTFRLNRGEATENINNKTETKNINYDVAKIMEQFKTPEEKKDFLLKQIHVANNTDNS